jgi:hypothetical protein
MRLPINPAQWGAYIIQALLQQLPMAEPYIQHTRILGSDPEGNGYGLIGIGDRAVVPFVVREFELKPLDVLITYVEGQPRFSALSEPNLMYAFNNVTLGEAVDRIPDSVDRDVFLEMMPPYVNGKSWGNSRRGPFGVYSSLQTVKLSHQILLQSDAWLANLKDAIKQASEADHLLPFQYALQHAAGRTDYRQVKAASGPEKILTLDPRPSGEVEVLVNGQGERVALKTASELLRHADQADCIPNLLRGELVVLDMRSSQVKEARSADPMRIGFADGRRMHRHPDAADLAARKGRVMEVKYPGWYDIDCCEIDRPLMMRVFHTTYLDGKPCSYKLAVGQEGFIFEPSRCWSADPSVPPSNTELRRFYQRAQMVPGELCFLLNHDTDEASIPFTIVSRTTLPGGGTSLQVRPLASQNFNDDVVTLTFGSNRHVYRLSLTEIAYPRDGFSVFAMRPEKLTCAHEPALPKRQGAMVRVFKGGGVWSLSENGRPPLTGLTRGQLVTHFMQRYGMTVDQAMDTLADLTQLKYDRFEVSVREELEQVPHAVSMAPIKLAMSLWRLVKSAEDPNQASGPNTPVGQAGEPGTAQLPAGVYNTSAGVPPEAAAGFQDLADVLVGYAASELPEQEMLALNTELVNLLTQLQDQLGRLLTLVRLGKIKNMTEMEVARVLRENDKFRAALINAAVAQGRVMLPAMNM